MHLAKSIGSALKKLNYFKTAGVFEMNACSTRSKIYEYALRFSFKSKASWQFRWYQNKISFQNIIFVQIETGMNWINTWTFFGRETIKIKKFFFTDLKLERKKQSFCNGGWTGLEWTHSGKTSTERDWNGMSHCGMPSTEGDWNRMSSFSKISTEREWDESLWNALYREGLK